MPCISAAMLRHSKYRYRHRGLHNEGPLPRLTRPEGSTTPGTSRPFCVLWISDRGLAGRRRTRMGPGRMARRRGAASKEPGVRVSLAARCRLDGRSAGSELDTRLPRHTARATIGSRDGVVAILEQHKGLAMLGGARCTHIWLLCIAKMPIASRSVHCRWMSLATPWRRPGCTAQGDPAFRFALPPSNPATWAILRPRPRSSHGQGCHGAAIIVANEAFQSLVGRAAPRLSMTQRFTKSGLATATLSFRTNTVNVCLHKHHRNANNASC